MKKFIFKIAILFLPLTLVMWSLGQYDNCFLNEQPVDINRIKTAEKFDSLDCLFAGSSYSYSGINPLEFDSLNWECYNLSVSGSGVYFIELLVEDYVANHKLPERMIIDISPNTFSGHSDDWYAYPVHRYLHIPRSHEEIVMRYNAFDDYFRLLRKSAYKGLSYLFSSDEFNNLNVSDSMRFYRGYYKKCTVQDTSSASDGFSSLNFLKSAEFDQSKLSKLMELIAEYEQKGVKIYWFIPPVQQLNACFSERFQKKYADALYKLRSLSLEITVDHSKFQLTDFRNADHLNCSGAVKLSRQIVEYFKKK